MSVNLVLALMLMNSIIISTVLILLTSISCSTEYKSSNSEYFEGNVTYKHDIFSKNTMLDSSALRSMFGFGSTLTFKEGSYLHKYDGGLINEDLYRKEDNKMYFKKFGSVTTFWVDCGTPGDKIIKFAFTPKKEKILGIECDELMIYYQNKIVSDYYNSDSLKINSEWFKRYVLDGEYIIDQKEKSISLKHKTEYANFIIIETATKIHRENVNDSSFNIASNEILVEQK